MKKWDVILLNVVPFVDLTDAKPRPALILSPNESLDSDQDFLVSYITSNITRMSPYDLIIDRLHFEFLDTGLHVSSALRINKINLLSKTLFVRKLGVFGPKLQEDTNILLRKFLQL